jgi:hypothetical protein
VLSLIVGDCRPGCGVSLYDRSAIKDWVWQADSRSVASAVLEDLDQRIYHAFLNTYSEMLNGLENHCETGARYVSELSQSPDAKEHYKVTHHSLYRYLDGLLQDLDALEERNPQLRADEVTARRRRLEARQRKIEQRAKGQGISVEPAKVQHAGADAFPQRAAKGPTPPENSVEPSVPVTNAPAERGHAVGDTVILEGGHRLTLHSYKSSVPPPNDWRQPKAGHEFSVVDVEVWTGSEPGEQLKAINPHDFFLRMPDNTRLKTVAPQHADRELNPTRLSPGDPVRGLIFFQTPEGEKPKSVIWEDRRSGKQHTFKWAI